MWQLKDPPLSAESPESPEKASRIFYGWWVALATFIAMLLAYGQVVIFPFGFFLKPLTEAFGCSRGEVSLALSLSLIGFTLAQPLVGKLADRYGSRPVILCAAFILGTGLLSLSYLTSTLWHLYLIYLLIGPIGAGTTPVPYVAVISRWFNKRRGIALSSINLAQGVGSTLFPLLTSHLIASVGWRHTYAIFGVLVWIVVLPTVALLIRERPEEMGLLPDGGRETSRESSLSGGERLPFVAAGMPFSQARRTATFWCMILAFLLMSAGIQGCLMHLPALLTDRGISPERAAFFVSLLGICFVVGGLTAGYLADRLEAKYVTMGYFLGATAGVVLLWVGQGRGIPYLFSLLAGMGMGAMVNLMAYLIGRCFGPAALGELYGYAFGAMALGGVVGPIFMGYVFDYTGSYRAALEIFVLATVLATGLIGPLRVYEKEKSAPEGLMLRR